MSVREFAEGVIGIVIMGLTRITFNCIRRNAALTKLTTSALH